LAARGVRGTGGGDLGDPGLREDESSGPSGNRFPGIGTLDHEKLFTRAVEPSSSMASSTESLVGEPSERNTFWDGGSSVSSEVREGELGKLEEKLGVIPRLNGTRDQELFGSCSAGERGLVVLAMT